MGLSALVARPADDAGHCDCPSVRSQKGQAPTGRATGDLMFHAQGMAVSTHATDAPTRGATRCHLWVAMERERRSRLATGTPWNRIDDY